MRARLIAAAIICFLIGITASYAEDIEDNPQSFPDAGAEYYQTQVLPILRAHCYSCHTAEPGGEVDSEFNMASRETFVSGGHSGPAIDEQAWSESAILRAINYEDSEMPPKGKLPQSQIATITRWVEMGAPWSDTTEAAPAQGPPPVDDLARNFWSFRPVKRPEVPAVSDLEFVRTPIDAFVLAKLEEAGLSPAAPARKTTLLRRVYYSLIGLPPTPEEAKAFLADDSASAFERVVDRLLDSPQYGERWARHWLDLVRYAETDGYEFDRAKPEVWRYRDYVIDSFNSDKPYDQFLKEQLAGDEMDLETASGIIATGYYRLGATDSGAAERLQAEFDELDDVIATTGQVMLGLSMNCARCHDHKIDPFPTADYYRMLAFFRGIKRGRGDSTRQIQVTPDGGDQQLAGRWEAEFDAAERGIQRTENRLRRHLKAGEADDFEEETYRPAIVRANSPLHVSEVDLAEYETFLTKRQELEDKQPIGLARALCVVERGPQPPQTHVLVRGSPYAKGDPVSPGFPSVLTSMEASMPTPKDDATSSGRRRVLAEWITSCDNPLTARVMVNRLWHYNFDRGIVRSTNDFGYAGTPPTHPKLLDWLASELVDGGWKLKRLQKMIVMSSVFQMSSITDDQTMERDPENDLFTRFNLRRLEGEEIRDSILAVSSNLNPKTHGPSIYPSISDEVLAGQSRPGEGWRQETPPEEQARRSVYVHVKRSLIVPLLAVFDAADTDASCPARFATMQPTQALTMLNSEFLNEQAKIFADDIRNEVGDDPKSQVAEALRRVTQREPNEVEIERGAQLMVALTREHGVAADRALQKFCLLAMNLNEFLCLD